MVVVLAEDLIMEIMLRVEPVSILKFKSVCKSWYSLISNPCFHRNHARQFQLSQRDRCVVDSPPGLLLCPEFRSSEHYSVYAILPQDEKPDPPPLLKLYLDHSLTAFKQKNSGSSCFLVDSCNGLLLYVTESDCGLVKYKVFNPITHQYKDLPIMDFLWLSKPNEIPIYNHPHIVFDPSISLSYKVLTLVRLPPYNHSQLYVHSSDDDDIGSWRLLTGFASNTHITGGMKTFMFNGVFYLLEHDALICFDVVEENVWFQSLPPIPAGYACREVIYFGECGGRLRLIEDYFVGVNTGLWLPCSFDIMEMEKGSTIWTVKTRVNIEEAGYDHLIQKRSYISYCSVVVRLLHLYETENGEEAILLNFGYHKLLSFNITTNTFGKELTIPNIEPCAGVIAFPFTPTLFPLLT